MKSFTVDFCDRGRNCVKVLKTLVEVTLRIVTLFFVFGFLLHVTFGLIVTDT